MTEPLILASEKTGRHLKRFKKDLNWRRRLVLERIDINGPLTQVPAWNQLSADVTKELRAMSNRTS